MQIVGKITRILLLPFSWLYGAAVASRNFLYQINVLKSFEFDVPVIVVGNLSAGGTGKTPHVEYLIGLLKDQYKIATLSRGYRRRSKGFIIADENADAKLIGDEPMQYHFKYPGITVAVGENRALAITEIMAEKEEIDAIILDDAFQHRAVNAGLNILITDYSKLFTKDALLPAGLLREPPGAAKRADAVIVSKCPETLSQQEMQSIKNQINRYYKGEVYFTGLAYQKWYDLISKEEVALQQDMEVIALTAIANPQPFYDHIKKEVKLVRKIAFPDHHYFTIKELQQVQEQFGHIKNGGAIVTTEKDAMRLLLYRDWIIERNLKIIVVPVKVYFLHNNDSFNFTISNFIRNFNSREN